MKITQASILKTIDKRFLISLNEAYTDNTPVDVKSLSRKVAEDISSNSYNNSLPSLIFDLNKGNGVSRPIPVFTQYDYFVYYYCIKKLENKLAVNRVPM